MTAHDQASEAHDEAGAVTRWRLIPARTRVEFVAHTRVLRLKDVDVSGTMPVVGGTIVMGTNGPLSAEATIDASRLDTGGGRRDAHLRSADFFDTRYHPTLAFRSTAFEAVDGAKGRYRVTGELTLRGRTYPLLLRAGGFEPKGGELRMSAWGEFDRQALGVNFRSRVIALGDHFEMYLTAVAELEEGPATPPR